jgi:hypothetical protein
MSSAANSKAYRQRKKDGAVPIRVLVSPEARDVLVDARWLPEWSETDKDAVQEAVQRLIDGIQVGKRVTE